MSQTHSCPVCGRLGLPPNCGSCPQCDADLTCFQALDSLSSPAAVKAATPPKRRFPWAVVTIIITAVLLLLAGLAVSMKSRLSELDRQLAELKATKHAAAIEQKHEPVTPPPKSTAEQPLLPPESKIQIDAQVRFLDEREAAAQAIATKQIAVNNDALDQQKSNEEPQEQKKTVEEKAAAQQEDKLPAAITQPDAPKVVKEELLPEAVEGASVGSKMPPLLPAEKTAGQDRETQAMENPAETKASPQVPESQPSNSEQLATPEEESEVAANQPETPPVALTPTFRKHRVKPTVLAVMDASGTSATEPQQATPPVQRGGTFSYVVKDGENAWDIAERFYGDRKYYPVLMEQNPHIFLGFIRKGSAVQLFADRREAAAFYQGRIEQRDGLLLWKYEVRPGETWRSIYARFFLPKYSGMVFYGDQEVTPGKTVRIILR